MEDRMQVEHGRGTLDGYVEFQWPKVHLMLGYDLAYWVVGIRVHRTSGRCVSLYLACFDFHFQWWSSPTVTGDA
jgi:hypothetical protein